MSSLDGLTILRYGHVYDSGGGIEQYLVDLNRALHARSRFATIQVQLTSASERVGEKQHGPVRSVSLFVPSASHQKATAGTTGESSPWRRLKNWGRNRVIFAPWVYRHVTGPALARFPLPARNGEPVDAGATVKALLQRHPVDLVVLHSAGCADVEEVLREAEAANIPVAYLHHFSNDRLSTVSVRRHLDRLDGIAGVCDTDVPSFLRRQFVNLSDGIDTDFFRREAATPPPAKDDAPIIFLPARLTPSKGQADLVRAAGSLKRRKLDFRVVLAGRTDTPQFFEELKALIAAEDVADRVHFAGQLGPAELRDWYARASILAFPTRHPEGLPRIMLESQAMQLPVVVYEVGGTASGLRDGQTGHLLRIGDTAGLEARLAALLAQPEARREMGRRGRALVEAQYSLAALAARHEQFYTGIVAARRRASRLAS